jgi:hypothetical protein
MTAGPSKALDADDAAQLAAAFHDNSAELEATTDAPTPSRRTKARSVS